MKTTSAAGLFVVIALSVSSLLFLLFRVIAARYLGPEDFGVLTIGIIMIKLGALISLFGIHHAIAHFVAQYAKRTSSKQLNGFIVLSFALPVTLSVLISLLLVNNAQLLSYGLFDMPSLEPYVWLFAFAIPLSTFVQLSKQYFFSQHRPFPAAITESVVERGAAVLFSLVAAVLLLNTEDFFLLFLMSFVLSALCAAYFLIPLIKSLWKPFVSPVIQFKETLTFSFPLLLAGALGLALAWTDTFFIGVYWDAASVGIYNVAYIIAGSLMLIWAGFGEVLYPIMTKLYAKKSYTSLKGHFTKTMGWVSYATFPFAVLFIVLGLPIITQVFGASYATALLPLQLLTVGYVIITLTGLAEQGLRTYKKTSFLGWSTLVFFLINVALNWILVPQFGMSGAAYATVITLFLIGLTRFVVFTITANIPWTQFPLKKIGITLSLSVLLGYGLLQLPDPNTVIHLAFYAAGFLVLYGVLGMMCKIVSFADFKELVSSLFAIASKKQK